MRGKHISTRGLFATLVFAARRQSQTSCYIANRIRLGLPTSILPILNFVLTKASRIVASEISVHGFEVGLASRKALHKLTGSTMESLITAVGPSRS